MSYRDGSVFEGWWSNKNRIVAGRFTRVTNAQNRFLHEYYLKFGKDSYTYKILLDIDFNIFIINRFGVGNKQAIYSNGIRYQG